MSLPTTLGIHKTKVRKRNTMSEQYGATWHEGGWQGERGRTGIWLPKYYKNIYAWRDNKMLLLLCRSDWRTFYLFCSQIERWLITGDRSWHNGQIMERREWDRVLAQRGRCADKTTLLSSVCVAIVENMWDNKTLNVGLVKFICVMHSLNKRIITKRLWAVTAALAGQNNLLQLIASE